VIARDIGADVEIIGERRQAGVAEIGASEQRARPRIALTIKQKVLGPLDRKDANVGLYEAGSDARRIAGIRAAADSKRPRILSRAYCLAVLHVA
jgi:hypothetical protein